MVREYGRKGIIQAFAGYLGGYILLQILLLGAYSLYMRSQNIVVTNDMIIELTIVSTFVASFVTLGLYVLFFRHILRYDFFRFTKSAESIRYVFAGFAGLYLMNLAVSLIYSFFQIEGTSLNQDLVQTLLTQQPVLMALPVVVFVPFIEEVLFRGVIYEVLSQRLSIVVSVILVNVIFALLHVSDIGSLIFMPVYFLLGVVLSTIYLWSGKNIWVSILAHSMHNLLSVVLILFLMT
jgi:membrane protease YdiL (CAAX protease family)